MGDNPDPPEVDLSCIQEEHAVNALIRLTKKFNGKTFNGFFCRLTISVQKYVASFLWRPMFMDTSYMLLITNVKSKNHTVAWIICQENYYYNRNCLLVFFLLICL